MHGNAFYIAVSRVPITTVMGVQSEGPAVDAERAREPKSTQESPPTASWSPGPTCTALDGEMIHAETNVGEQDAHG